jgi:hypothetical protein
MEYEEAVKYIMQETEMLDLTLLDKDKCIEEMKPKEKAAI